MTTAPVLHPRRRARERARVPAPGEWTWLAVGLALAFAVPFVFADVLEVPRDGYYAIHALATVGLVGAWLGCDQRRSLRAFLAHRWRRGVAFGVAAGAVMVAVVLRVEDAAAGPDARVLAGALVWGGVVYGATAGLLLSAFPILVV
jgi:hypothetical protein